jgi:hypothetical protein
MEEVQVICNVFSKWLGFIMPGLGWLGCGLTKNVMHKAYNLV